MGIATEYAKRSKTPLVKATITRFWASKPSVNGVGTDYYPEVVSVDSSFGFDQGTATCTILIKSPLDADGDYVRFEPMDRVHLKQGWNVTSTLRTTFFGFVDTVEHTNPPKYQRLQCRDILKLAQDFYLIHSNRKVYSAEVDESELDEEGLPMGGQDIEARQAQCIITDFLTESGIPESRLNLDFEDYPASGAIIIGNNATAVFVYESALDAVNRICDLIGYRIWADPVGNVQCREVRPFASVVPALSYTSGESSYTDGEAGFELVTSGNLININSNVDDDLRNWVTVIGYGDVTSTVVGDSDYVSDPPRYRRTEIRSYLLDTPELVNAVAERVYEDLNRLRYTGNAEIEGDPRLEIGLTLEMYDEYVTSSAINYFLYDYSHTLKAGSWTSSLGLVGGTGPGAPPADNVSPVALMKYSIEQEYCPSGTMWDVHLDGTDSYDPDGDFEDLSFHWTVSGIGEYTGSRASFVYVGESLTTYVTLTVTDSGDPPLSNSVTILIQSIGLGESVFKTRQIFIASDTKVYSTLDGGISWASKVLY
jgi:hypothetical protein